jgi:hypothetical protein
MRTEFKQQVCILLTIVCLGLSSATSAWAAPGAAGKSENEGALKGPRKHLSVIVLSGVAGAILGLSTLSFYGRPQDKLSNIAGGAAVGIIIGAMYTTYRAAAEPREFYGLHGEPREPFATTSSGDLRLARASAAPTVRFSISF